ncbi:helix-turn-helix, Psq domain [Peptostreptococcus russellii]|uniref:Helix-turn-helix, Psq domain n=1 Tax=Peptostreptococcus russellii TaxID=215200 RepID=A0A1H8HV21_9FIRM|nr:SEC-C domain-containing protein [Peptostreptococcus russellii]SEN60039.1 helix-turn-helix, Psq domain [Peptostreptococcus russellii]
MLKRNDKCYCGSGKKYKNCCMNKDREEKVEMLNKQALDSKKEKIDKKYTGAIIKLSGYLEELIVGDEKFAKYEEEARKAFFDENMENNMVANRFFASYFSYDYAIGREMTPAVYVANNKRFTNDEKQIIYGCVNSYPSMFEIDSINGREVIIKDVFSNRKFNTLDSKILGEFNVGDYILARPILVEDTFVLIDLTIRIQKETKDLIYKSIMDAFEASKEANPNIGIEYFVMINTLFFYKYMIQLLQASSYSEEEETVELEDAEEVKEVVEKELEEAEETVDEAVEEALEVEEVVEGIEELDEVAKLISSNISEKEVLDEALKLWDIVAKNTEITGSEGGWAAGLEYNYRKSLGETVTQNEVAKAYGVSASTLAKRNKEITALVSDK